MHISSVRHSKHLQGNSSWCYFVAPVIAASARINRRISAEKLEVAGIFERMPRALRWPHPNLQTMNRIHSKQETSPAPWNMPQCASGLRSSFDRWWRKRCRLRSCAKAASFPRILRHLRSHASALAWLSNFCLPPQRRSASACSKSSNDICPKFLLKFFGGSRTGVQLMVAVVTATWYAVAEVPWRVAFQTSHVSATSVEFVRWPIHLVHLMCFQLLAFPGTWGGSTLKTTGNWRALKPGSVTGASPGFAEGVSRKMGAWHIQQVWKSYHHQRLLGTPTANETTY